MNRPTKVIASALGLTAFAIATIAGLSVGNPTGTVLWHAIVSMILCQLLGLAIGSIGEGVVNDAVAQHKARNPIPRIQDQILVVDAVDEPEAPGAPERSAA